MNDYTLNELNQYNEHLEIVTKNLEPTSELHKSMLQIKNILNNIIQVKKINRLYYSVDKNYCSSVVATGFKQVKFYTIQNDKIKVIDSILFHRSYKAKKKAIEFLKNKNLYTSDLILERRDLK